MATQPEFSRPLHSAGAGRVVAPDVSETTGANSPRRKAPPTQALVFEMANVLYDATLWWRWFAQLLARLHPNVDGKQLAQQWNDHFLADIRRGRREFGEAFEAFLTQSGLTRGRVDEILAAGLSRRRDLEFEVLPFPGVKPTLRRLQQAGVPMAIVSDSANTSEELSDRLARLGLGKYFDHVVSSVELGEIKPAAICYETVLKRLEVDRSAVWFVSQVTDDLHGAARCGLRTVGYNASPQATCDHLIGRFEGLVELLALRPSAVSV